MTEISEKALEEIKTKVSAASWDHADEMKKSQLANEIWWLAHNALEAAALARAEAAEGVEVLWCETCGERTQEVSTEHAGLCLECWISEGRPE